MTGYHGLLGLIILIIDIWAIVNTLGSSLSVGRKVLWIVIIILLPFLGAILWLLIGARAPKL